MNNYETTFLMKDNITEEQRNNIVKNIKQYLTENASVTDEKNIGKRKLAYEIRKYQYAYYYVIQFTGKADIISELERKYRLNDDVLKFITVKIDN